MKKPSLTLSDLVVFGAAPKDQKPVMSVAPKDTRKLPVHIMVHPSKWPRHLLEEHREDLLYVFRELFVSVSLPEDTQVALCAQSCCDQKRIGEPEVRNCPYFCGGVCTPATQRATDEERSFAFIAGILGKTKQAYQQAMNPVYKDLQQTIRENPLLLEILSLT